MPTGDYRLSNDKKVAGVTTIMNPFKDQSALIHWAWGCGMKGIDYKKERDKAGGQGTSIHDLAEKYILDQEFELPEDKKIQKAFAKFVNWWDSQQYKIVWTEKQMVSESYEFGGCPDLLVKDKDDKFVLIDFKTGKHIYQETVIQLGAYARLIFENEGNHITKGIIVRLPKDNSKLETKEFNPSQLTLGWDQFKLFREAHSNNKIIDTYFRKDK
jgi:hypothetical protein